MEEVYEFLNNAGVYYIATIDGDQPRVRAFTTILEHDGKLYIQTGRVKDVYKQIKANPKVEICVWDGKADWVRVACTLVEDPNVEIEAAMLDKYPELKGMYTAGDGNTVVFYMQDATATFASFVNEPHVVEF